MEKFKTINKILGDKKISIRKLAESDLRRAKDFQKYINSLIEEDAKLLMNKPIALKDEKDFLKNTIKTIKEKKCVFLVAEHNKKIVGVTDIKQDRWRRNHIGHFGISIRNNYRGIGLGTQMMSEVIKLAKKEIKPKPKIVALEVYENNKPAIGLYKKMGFKVMAKLPKQIQYKGRLISEYIMLLDLTK